MKNLYTILLIAFIFTLTACQQAEMKKEITNSKKTTLSNEHYQIKNGTIYFAKQTDLVQLNTKLSNMSDEERLK